MGDDAAPPVGESLERVRRMLDAVRRVNRLIVRTDHREALLQGACDVLVDICGHFNAWIATVDDAGRCDGFVQAGLTPREHETLAAALASDRPPPCVLDPAARSVVAPLRDCPDCPLVARYADRCGMNAPLLHDGELRGCLTVSAPCDLVRDEEAQALFRELAADIAYALHHLDAHEQSQAMAEANRRETERLAVLANAFPDLVFVLDAEGRYREVLGDSGRATAQREEVVGKTVRDTLPPDTAASAADSIRRALETGAPQRLEYTRPIGGEERIFEARVTRLREPVDGDAAVLWISRDITVRKRAAAALQESEAAARTQTTLLRTLIDGLPDIVALQEPDHTVLFYNEAGYRFLGLSPEEANGRKCYELIGQSTPCEVCATSRARESGRVEVAEKHLPEQDTYLEARSIPVRDETGRVVRLVEILRDITVRKHAEIALQESEERFRSIFDSSEDCIFLKDRDLRYVQVNPAVERLFDRPASEITGRIDEDLFDVETAERIRTSDQHVLAGEHLEEETVREVGGVSLVFHIHKTPVFGADGGVCGLAGIARNVTERRELETRLRQAEKLQAIGQLAGGVAHDFNNQLAGILGYAELLARRLEDERQRGFAEHILMGARRASDLTRQLLSFARQGQVRSSPVHLHETIRECIAVLERSIDPRVEIRCAFAADAPWAMGDPSRLQNMVLNLALNARDAMPDGGTLTFATSRLELRAEDELCAAGDLLPGPYVRISVIDTGCGMDAQTQAHIFEPFFTTKETGKGTGMGLAASYGTIEQHDGAIRVESAPGAGATFHVYLPLAGARERRKSDCLPAATAVAERPGNILVIDDEEVFRRLATDILTPRGHRVVTREDGEAGIAYFRDHTEAVDLVIIDMIMPHLGGRATFHALRAIDPDIPVLLASGYSLEGEAQGLLDAGAAGYLQKPFLQQDLIEAVARALAPDGDNAAAPEN